MPNKQQPVWVNVIAFIGLAASLAVVIHSLVTGEGIHTLALVVGIFMVLHLLREWRRRA